MSSQAPNISNEPAPRRGMTVEQIRHEVTVTLDRMTALDLADLKTDLDAASAQKGAVITDYCSKYKALRQRWAAENQAVVKLHQTLTCTFEHGEWRQISQSCVCELQGVVANWNQIITDKTNCSKGFLERDVAKAQAQRDAAKAARDSWMAAAAGIDAQLTTNDATIKTIQGLIGGPDQSQAIYLFWFVLLPAHRQLMPEDAPRGAIELGQGESPADICGLADRPHRAPPWLVEPDHYGATLDAAWDHYFEAQTHYAQCAAAFKEKPDDLATITQTRDALTASLVADITQCLKNCAAHPQSCNGSSPSTGG